MALRKRSSIGKRRGDDGVKSPFTPLQKGRNILYYKECFEESKEERIYGIQV